MDKVTMPIGPRAQKTRRHFHWRTAHMSLAITFLGHSGFMLDDGTNCVVIDPFLTGNPVAVTAPVDVRCTHVALTHGHADHFGDTVKIAMANNATVVAAFEIIEYLATLGIDNGSPGNPGGRIAFDFGWIAFTHAFHSSSLEGKYMGMPCGLVVHIGGTTIYHCGDTGLFSDMKLIGEIYKPDIALIPIGDRFTMGPELATRAAEMIAPKVAIPIHYGTFDALVQTPAAFTPAGVEVRVMTPGECWDYDG